MPGRLNDRAAQSVVLSAQPASAINVQKRLHQMAWPFVGPDIGSSGRRVRRRGQPAAWGKSGTSAYRQQFRGGRDADGGGECVERAGGIDDGRAGIDGDRVGSAITFPTSRLFYDISNLTHEGLHRHEAVHVLKEPHRFLRWATPLPSRKEIVLLLLGILVQIEMRRPREQTQGSH